MYDEFLRPTLLVGLFAEPEDLSAAAVLNTLYFYGAFPSFYHYLIRNNSVEQFNSREVLFCRVGVD